jgi:hypothetical protein
MLFVRTSDHQSQLYGAGNIQEISEKSSTKEAYPIKQHSQTLVL